MSEAQGHPNTELKRWKAVLGAAFCALLWGSAFPCIKYVYSIWAEQSIEVSMHTRWWFAGVRFTLSGLGLLLISRSPFKQLRQTPLRYMGGMALCQTLLQYIFFYLALSLASSSLCSLMSASGSFWWLLLAPLFGKAEWGKGWKVWGILVLGALGVSMAVYSPGDPSFNPLLGVAVMLLATLCGTLAVLLFSKIKPTMKARTATGFSLFSGGVALCMIGLPAMPDSPALFSPPVILITLYLAFVSATAFSVWYELSTRYPVSLLASLRFMIPISGVLLSVAFIQSEKLSVWIMIGTMIVSFTMVLAVRLHGKVEKSTL